jgi:Family of unknown function (DUF5681)
MRFQPGQSGNPAGRPPGSRNKATIAREQELARKAAKAAESIVFLAGRGDPVAMRICAEWAQPSGTNRSPALELPPITCSDDAQIALDTVLVAFGDGALTSRELPVVLGGVERAVRIADRIHQMREREREGRQIRGELHPGMLPRPTGKPDPFVVALRAAGEEVPAYLATASDANEHGHVRLFLLLIPATRRRVRPPTRHRLAPSRARRKETACIFLLIWTRSLNLTPLTPRHPRPRAANYQANLRLMPPSTISSRPVT